MVRTRSTESDNESATTGNSVEEAVEAEAPAVGVERAAIEHCLRVVGFTRQADRDLLINDGFESFDDFKNMKERDVNDAAEEFSKRTVNDGRIIFGNGRIRRLKGLMHWVQDAYRCNRKPDHTKFTRDAITTAIERADGRKDELDLSDIVAKATKPDNFTKEKEWPAFETAFTGYLDSIPGSFGIPLSYVIREKATPDPDMIYPTFNKETIACAPLKGTKYQLDNKRVHRLLRGLIRGGPAEEWIRAQTDREDGRRDMIALRAHFAGEGNASRRIAEADRLRDTLSYKSERTLPFATFLDRIQKMFNIYREEDQELTEETKIRELIRMCQHSPALSGACSNIELRQDVEPITFQQAANHLRAVASRYHIRGNTSVRNVSESGTNDRASKQNHSKDERSNRRIRTGYYSRDEWEKLSFEERDKVRELRTKKGLKGGKSKNYRGKRHVEEVNTESQADEANDSDEDQGAGNAFGGKREASKKKKKKKSGTSGVTSIRRAAKVKSDKQNVAARMELDTHADTCVIGPGFLKIQDTGNTCTVQPYISSYKEMADIPIISAATAVQDQATGETIILVIHQGLWFGDNPSMTHSLINPNQMRAAGVHVQDNPYLPDDPIRIQSGDDAFPLQASGTVLYLNCRTPTDRELQTCRHVELTKNSDWDPSEVQFPQCSATDSTKYSVSELSVSELGTNELDRIVQVAAASSSETTVQLDTPSKHTFMSKDRHSMVSAQSLSEKWQIGVQQAAKTIKATTQAGVRSALMPLGRRYRADRMFHRRRLHDRFYTDTMVSRYKSRDGNKYAQIFANESLFTAVYPIESKSHAGKAFTEFINEFGVPNELVMDGAMEQTGKHTDFRKALDKHEVSWDVTEPHRHNQNRAEMAIRELKRKWYRIMVRKRVPERLWDYGLRWVSDINNRTSNSIFRLHGRTPLEQVTGETPDITEYVDFGFYDFVWVRENAGLGEQILCRWLGVAHRVGSQLCYYVLKQNGEVIARTTVQRVTNVEMTTREVKQRCDEFDKEIAERMATSKSDIDAMAERKRKPSDWAIDSRIPFDDDFQNEFNRVVDDPDIVHGDSITSDVGQEQYLNMELAIPSGPDSAPKYGKVVKRLRGEDGKPIGKAHSNPMLDTRKYQVELVDGTTLEMTANKIAENLYAQVDDEGRRHVLVDEIIDHRRGDDALSHANAWITSKNGNKTLKKTTRGWQLLIQWKDGSTNWVELKDAKESFPLEVIEYARGRNIHEEPAFAWWIPTFLAQKKRIISKIKSKYWLTTHKFGIRIPKTVKEALELDRQNGNTFWADAIKKEMGNVRVAFEAFEGDERDIPKEYQKIDCHIIFDVKMSENFRRKARLVAGGHTTETPSTLTYSSVVSRDSVRIALTLAALNDLDVQACDIQNAYITADCREKIYTIAGPEFGSEEGTIMIIRKALYGLKSSGAAFRALLAETLHDCGFIPTIGDPDVHIRPAAKENGDGYYEMILTYVDDIICISHRARETLEEAVKQNFKIKNDLIQPPDIYLGAQLSERQLTGQRCWTMTSNKYITAAIQRVTDNLKKRGDTLPNKCVTPMRSGYRPEIDESDELDAADLRTYQEYIGILRWAVELGRIDIMVEVSMLSAHLANPRKGHLEQALHIFGYLKLFPKRTLAFDPRHPNIAENRFVKHDWSEFYRGAAEEMPPRMPAPKGKEVTIHCFVDASHADNRRNRRSQTGILIFLNRSPIIWYSKRQSTVETSTFGSEMVAMRIATEQIQALRIKLRSFGVPVEGAASVYCDNDAVTKAARMPESTLAKKHNAVAYHKVREAVAMGMIRVAWEDTHTNLADLLTKMLTQRDRERLIDRFMY